jgi:hypothetical protein
MPQQSEILAVYAEIKAPASEVVCAAHPTQATMANYQPPFLRSGKEAPGVPNDEGSLQRIGSAVVQSDGSIRITLISDPPSNTLIVRRVR